MEQLCVWMDRTWKVNNRPRILGLKQGRLSMSQERSPLAACRGEQELGGFLRDSGEHFALARCAHVVPRVQLFCSRSPGLLIPQTLKGLFPGQMKQRLCPLLIIFAMRLVLPMWGMVRAALPKL